LHAQTKSLEDYQKQIDTLESRIGGSGFYEAIKGMGLDAHEQLVGLNQLTDAQLQSYVDMYDKRSALAEQLANDELKDDIANESAAAYKTFADTVAQLGGEVVEQLEGLFAPLKESLSTLFGGADATGMLSNTSLMTYAATTGSGVGNTNASTEVQKKQEENTSTMLGYLKAILDTLRTAFPQLAEAFDVDVVLDTGVLVGALAPEINTELGKISMRKDRGR
jgi:hypothetical protein